jgi:hypothetical protein
MQSNNSSTDKPLPQIRGKAIDGVLYVRAEDVADCLGELGASTNRRLIAKLHAAAAAEKAGG